MTFTASFQSETVSQRIYDQIIVKFMKKLLVDTRARPVDTFLKPLESVDFGACSRDKKTSGPPFMITAARNYLNGMPHIGHAYEGILMDVFTRFHRLIGDRVFQGAGTDEHGQKVAATAEAQELTPIQLCDRLHGAFSLLNQRLLLDVDVLTRSTSKKHEENALEMWRRCEENGDIYLSHYEGWYISREERFVTEHEAKQWNYLDPDSGVDLKRVSESSYFFRLSKYREEILKLLEDDDFVRPEQFRNLLLERLKEPLLDVSISRTSFSWGIPCPKEGHVMYVWFDALTTYLTDIDYFNPESGNSDLWENCLHLLGKDILWFHAVIFQAMLISAKLPTTKSLIHGFVLDKDGRKMSKSLNNTVCPNELLQEIPADSFRWYLCRETSFGKDPMFSVDNMKQIHNSDLCNSYGNLIQRSLKLSKNRVPKYENLEIELPFDLNLRREKFVAEFRKFEISFAAQTAKETSDMVNKWLYELEPWKEKDSKKRDQIVRMLLEACYCLSHFFLPFCPDSAKRVFQKFSTEDKNLFDLDPKFSTNLEDEIELKSDSILFTPFQEKSEKKDEKKPEKKDERPWKDSSRLEIRVGKIISCKEHPEADKLWVEEIDFGSFTRQICTGLRGIKSFEEMMERKVLCLLNLKPRLLRGVESRGMVLCAGQEFLEVPENSELGTRVFFGDKQNDPDLELHKKDDKNAWILLQPHFRTNENGHAIFDEKFWQLPTGEKISCLAKLSQIS